MASPIGISAAASTDYGVTATYGVVISSILDCVNRKVYINVGVYYDESAYLTGSQPLVYKDEKAEDVDYETYFEGLIIGAPGSTDPTFLEQTYEFLANANSSGFKGGTLDYP